MRALTIPTRGVERKRLRGQSCQETTYKCSDAVKGDSRRSLTRPQSETKRLRCCRGTHGSHLSMSGKNHSAAVARIGVNLVGVVRTTVPSERA